ncbi:MAG: 30S ribosome-binding factor RbfA [Proteobacteria bacterium]|nr:30S ribosome-binding factor RbfA [Pseudomonadota bacterium]
MTPKGPSQRQLRVGEEIRHILAETLTRGQCGDPLLDNTSITVTEVQISPDFQHANVYVMPLGGQHLPETLSALKEKAWYFRKEVAHALKIRVTPRLVFHADRSFDEAERIENLLKSVKVQQDTKERD